MVRLTDRPDMTLDVYCGRKTTIQYNVYIRLNVRTMIILLIVYMLDKLPAHGRHTKLDDSRASAYCAGTGCGWGLFGHFFSPLSFLSSFSLSLW